MAVASGADLTYHPDPLRTGSARKDDSPCILCGRTDLLKYDAEASFDEELDEEQLCIRCIVSGEAHERLGAEFTKHFSAEDGWKNVPAEIVEQIRERTPAVFTWQSPRWLACCDDACVYLGVLDESGADEANSGASLANLDEFLDAASSHAPSWYLFRCRRCRRHLTFSDEP